MNQYTHATSETIVGANKLNAVNWAAAAVLYARIALGAAFLSAVAARFGLWHGTFDMEYFGKFLQYAAEVNSFMPSAVIPLLAWTATVAETTLGLLLILGLWPRWVSLGSAILLAIFGTAMAVSFGLKSPMDYSVFSASGAAVLLTLHAFGQNGKEAFKKLTERMVHHDVEMSVPRPRSGLVGRIRADTEIDGQLLGAISTDHRPSAVLMTSLTFTTGPSNTVAVGMRSSHWVPFG